ncbi:MAG TPA: 4a-hydroxytetrahydrobiopterin dehydratase [Phycisphaerales bacterium]|nr:4a-hydroxytetrahydrobiopterin dehydratase [Phycisphaerales bacterium]
MAKRTGKASGGGAGLGGDRIYKVARLSETQIAVGLERLTEWAQVGDTIQRTFTFKDFIEAMKFVDKAAAAAEAVQHHPDILIRYNRVTMTLSTHDAGGISQKDMDMAGALDRMG